MAPPAASRSTLATPPTDTLLPGLLGASAPLRLLARLTQISVTLILSHRGHPPRRTRSPALPGAASPACHPDLPVRVRTQTGDPGEPICFSLGYLHKTRSGLQDSKFGPITARGRSIIEATMVHLRGRYGDEFGSATFDRPSTGSQGAEEPDGGVQVPRSPRCCHLAGLTHSWFTHGRSQSGHP